MEYKDYKRGRRAHEGKAIQKNASQGGGPVEEQCDLGSREKVEMKKGLAFFKLFFFVLFFKGGGQSRDPRLFRGPLQRRRTDGLSFCGPALRGF